MINSLLNDIFDLGEQMNASLEKKDLETFVTLSAERGTLLDELKKYSHPSEIDTEWEAIGRALTEQQAELIAASERMERQLQAALDRLERVWDAGKSYLQPPLRQRTILNENLRV